MDKCKKQPDIDITASSDGGKNNGLDLIRRQAAIDYCYQLINVEHQQGSDDMNYGAERVNQTETILHHLEFMASAEPERKGKWIYNPYYVCYECSECGEQALEKFTVNERTLDRDYDEVLSKFCPYCGSRMVEVEDEEDEW